ncbi:MAG: TRAP transporter large permease subunit, partial [candidate division WOR-3 bacterium]
ATFALFFMVALTFCDVILRYLFLRPIHGAMDIVEALMIPVVFLGIPFTYVQKSLVKIDIFTERLNPQSRVVIEFSIGCIILGLLLLIVFQTINLCVTYLKRKALFSPSLPVPSAFFAIILLAGCIILLLLVLRDLLEIVFLKVPAYDLHWYQRFMMVGFPAIFFIFAYLWVHPALWQINPVTIAIMGVLFSLLLLLTGTPVAFVFILTSLLFISHVRGLNAALENVAISLFRTPATYLFATVNFFVVMGYFVLFSKFSEDMYYAAYRWFGHLPGGLAIATLNASAAISATVGDNISVCSTMTAIALPQMRKYNYNECLTVGCISAGALLGPIIPPSVTFVLYGVIVQGVSIGDLLVAGLIPGLLTTLVFCLAVYIWCSLKPEIGPRGPSFTWYERITSLKAAGPIGALFILVIGGLYGGVFSPCEGGAIGAIGALAFMVFYKRFTWKTLLQCFIEAEKVVSGVFFIVIGAKLFTSFVEWCNLSNALMQVLSSLQLSTSLVALLIISFLLFLGFIIDALTLLLVCIPIFHPVIVTMGADPIWFAVLAVFTINLGVITPPVGIVLFAIKAMARDIPIRIVYWGALPFVGAGIMVLIVLFTLPFLSTWLPNLIK